MITQVQGLSSSTRVLSAKSWVSNIGIQFEWLKQGRVKGERDAG